MKITCKCFEQKL